MNDNFIISKNGEVLCRCSADAEGAVTIPEGILAIRQNAFKDCKGITDVMFPSTLYKIGSNAFQGCDFLKSIQLPSGVEYIGKAAFKDCHSMSSVVIPPSVKELPNSVFENNYDLRYVKLPESGLKSIGDNCFKLCVCLRKIVIPRSVVRMGRAFMDCWALEKVIMRTESVSMSKSAFDGCSDRLTINCVLTVKEFFKYFSKHEKQFIIRKNDFAGRVLWPNSLHLGILPVRVKAIEEEAFRDCTGLESIGIPQSVKEIQTRTFSGCDRLTDVTIEEGVEVIAKNAFENCTSLTDLHFPDSLRMIEEGAFAGCTSLKKVIMSKQTSVAPTAFDSNNTPQFVYRN